MNLEDNESDIEKYFNPSKKTILFVPFSDIKISTITMNAKLISNDFNAEELFNNIKLNDNIIYVSWKNCEKGTRETKKKKKGSFFKNQVTITMKFMNKSKKSYIHIMVFNNSIKIPGCKTPEQGEYIINKLKELFENLGKNWEINSLKMPMFVFYYDIGFEINRDDITEYINESSQVNNKRISMQKKGNKKLYFLDNKPYTGYYAKYTPETFHGVKVNYYKDGVDKVSYTIFRTGKIKQTSKNIIGINTDVVSEQYDSLIFMLSKNPNGF